MASAKCEWILMTIPREDWRQIVSDVENMCGKPADEIEILQSAKEVGVLIDLSSHWDDDKEEVR